MKTADAHCDTLTEFPEAPFSSKNAAWDAKRFRSVGGILQYMAICTYPTHTGDSALTFAAGHIGNFLRQKPDEINFLQSADDFRDDRLNILLALENAAPIVNKIENLYMFHKLGVRAITLTWNHRNFLGDGVYEKYGLTEFGKEAVREMEKLKIIVDVSHLNPAGFDDLLSVASRPFAATHSNAKGIYDHPRNLDDNQIKEIIKRKGFIGLNAYSVFLGDSKTNHKTMFFKHLEYMLSLGAEEVLGFGMDFDGMDASPFPDCSCYTEIANSLSSELNLNDNLIEKIMHKNLTDFTLKMI